MDIWYKDDYGCGKLIFFQSKHFPFQPRNKNYDVGFV